MTLGIDGTTLCTFTPFSADAQWKFGAPVAVEAGASGPIRFSLPVGGVSVAGELAVTEHDGAVELAWSYAADKAVSFYSLGASTEFAVGSLIGGTWKTDDQQGTFPALLGEPHLFNRQSRSLSITTPQGQRFDLAFTQPTYVTIQDNRRWGGQIFTIRVGQAGTHAPRELGAGGHGGATMTVSLPDGVRARRDLPQTVVADERWVELATELDIEPGSALDFSGMGLIDGPCGGKGRVIATP